MPDKRKSDRVETLNLSYVLLNEEGQSVHQGMGRTRNLSEKGVLLETAFDITSNYSVILSIGLADEIVDIRGRVIHSRPLENGMFGVGIEFYDVSDAEVTLLMRFFKAHFHHGSENPHNS